MLNFIFTDGSIITYFDHCIYYWLFLENINLWSMQTSAQLFDQGFFFNIIKNKLRPRSEGINFLDLRIQRWQENWHGIRCKSYYFPSRLYKTQNLCQQISSHALLWRLDFRVGFKDHFLLESRKIANTNLSSNTCKKDFHCPLTFVKTDFVARLVRLSREHMSGGHRWPCFSGHTSFRGTKVLILC